MGVVSSGVDPANYCTVHQTSDGTKVRWDMKRPKLIVPRREINLSSQPRRSALKPSTAAAADPLTPVEEAPPGEGESSPAARPSRFMVKKVPEGAGSAEMLPMVPLNGDAMTNGGAQNGITNGVSLDGDSGASSDEPTTNSLAVSPPGSSTERRRSSTPRKGSTTSDVYDSLVSNSSRAGRLRDGIAKMMPKRSGNLDLEERKQSADQRLNRQFSLSDMHQGEGDGLANMSQMIQRTLDRTTQMLSGIKGPSVPTDTEVRLRRAWRRRQLNREVELRDVIEVDTFPLAVNVDTPLVQVHKMFAMLCANKMYVMDRRRLVGCLPLQRLSEFITRGHMDDLAPTSVYDTVTSAGQLTPRQERRGSQDTLDEIDDSVYDTITEPPVADPPPAATSPV
ncbi:uncharacterized protein LOC119109449 [Pollicipes pollicipes]|uniref:uncharacterized protein LOC119109449 n=1 Tax=Pollicipes pollicipes TaxID=41117 RepID=UPI00188540D4|nr:uncharacterized protein LOC119109449 [Pollicipes pollicipes]